MNVDILYLKYYDENQKKVTLGGIQTYITNLVHILRQINVETRIVQYSNHADFEEAYDGCKIAGFSKKSEKYDNEYLYKCALKSRKKDIEYFTIFATDTLIPRMSVKNSLAIQHGIGWDIPRKKDTPFFIGAIGRFIHSVGILGRVNRVDSTICVDYNFLNWYRTFATMPCRNIHVIPNFTHIPMERNVSIEGEDHCLRIIFARRFFEYRGTRIFGEAVSKLLKEHNDIEVTIAGSGPDKEYFDKLFADNHKVNITNYTSEESIAIHSRHDIAVVPTIGSEGTSLSLLEAMACGCAVVCTNVGGMTNIVIDGFNGLMVDSGDSQQLYEAMKKLVEDSQLREKLANNGYETVKNGFSYEKWHDAWVKVFEDVIK